MRTNFFRAQHHTFGHGCTPVWRTHLSIHSDNHNSSGTRTTSRVQHDPPLSSLWQFHNYHLHTLHRRHTSHLHTRNRHLCANYSMWVVPVPWYQKIERSTDKGKAEEGDNFPLGRLKREPVRTHLVCDVQRRRSTHDHVDPCAHMRLSAMRQGYQLQDRRRGSISTVGTRRCGRDHLQVWVCRRCSLNCNYSPQKILTMGNDTS